MTWLTAALYLAALTSVPERLPAPGAPAVMGLAVSFASDGPSGDRVDPPHGYAVMCETDKPLCNALAASNPGTVERDPAVQRALLEQVNHLVNLTVRQVSDEVTSGVPDMWRRTGLGPDARGDCEDLAIEKRLALIAAGFPAEQLYFAVGYRSGLGLHTVLVAHTDRGEIVLDGRTAALASWDRAPYLWVSRQTPGAPGVWTDPQPMLAAPPRAHDSSRMGTTAALVD